MNLVEVALPLSLAFIMFSLGAGLTVADFTRVFRQPRAILIGGFNQILLLPLVAFGLVMLFGLSGPVAVGFMILSFCPGGVTSNVISRLAKADVALSVSLTAIISLASMVTLPVLLVWTVGHFEGAEAPPLNISSIAIAMALISTVPILLGMAFRAFGGARAIRSEKTIARIANLLFVVIVVAALATNWATFIENLPSLGPALVVLCAVLLVIGYVVTKRAGCSVHEAKTISIETGIQNAALGITVATLLSGGVEGFTAYTKGVEF